MSLSISYTTSNCPAHHLHKDQCYYGFAEKSILWMLMSFKSFRDEEPSVHFCGMIFSEYRSEICRVLLLWINGRAAWRLLSLKQGSQFLRVTYTGWRILFFSNKTSQVETRQFPPSSPRVLHFELGKGSWIRSFLWHLNNNIYEYLISLCVAELCCCDGTNNVLLSRFVSPKCQLFMSGVKQF